MDFKSEAPRYVFPDIATFPAASASRLRYCFHTMADGRIPITPEWQIALAAFAEYAHSYVQVEHPYGQMSVRMTRRELVDSLVAAPDGTCLNVHPEFEGWEAAWGRLGICNCCGSPGHVAYHNASGARFLQISPESGTNLQAWARFLSGIAVQCDEVSIDPDRLPVAIDYQTLPEAAQELKLSTNGFFQLLRLMSTRGEVLDFTLPRTEASLRHRFVLEGIYLEGRQLHGRGLGVGFVLNLAAVRGFATHNTESGHLFLVLGPDERVLFSILHRHSSSDATFWETALNQVL